MDQYWVKELNLPITDSSGSKKNTLNVLPEHQKTEAAHIVARAFRYDALFTYITSNDETVRVPHLSERFKTMLVPSQKQLNLIVTDEKGFIKNVALWQPPGVEKPEPEDEEVKMAIRNAMGEEAWNNRTKLMNALDALEEQVMQNQPPHWHLFILATDPGYQKQGVAKFALDPILQLANKHHHAVYLESGPENERFYHSFGFVTVGRTDSKDDIPVTLALRKDPSS